MSASVDDHLSKTPPLGSILPAKAKPEEARVVEREWTNPTDGRRYRVGTAGDAGRLCVTAEAPNGVDGRQYRRMLKKPPRTYEAPPGPIRYRPAPEEAEMLRALNARRGFVGEQLEPPAPAGEVVLTDPVTGHQLYDLDAVERWNAGRPGRGRWQRRKPTDEEDGRLVAATA